MQELYEYVHEKVREEGAQEPMKWALDTKGKLVIARSRRGLRRQEIERLLHRFAAGGLLTSRIVHEAIEILHGSDKKQNEADQQRLILIEQLVGKKIGAGESIEQWVEIRFLNPAVMSAPRQGDIMTDEMSGMEFIYIPQGCFMMGSDEHKNDGPTHEVCLDAFWMGKYQVTQGQWKQLMGNNPAGFKNGDSYPVEQVSWENAQKFIVELNKKTGKNYRLPTEAEWEYAGRAKSSYKYSGGNDVDAVAWYDDNSGDATHPVGQKKANAFGLYDMSGNVCEWCSDWFDKKYYASSPKNNPTGPASGTYRVFRGGSYCDGSLNCRSVYRYRYHPETVLDLIGLRLVLPFQVAGS
ncbi:MAG: formylglycine-generating enzyme family protein [Candidatus Electrothrix sp. ATG2]|nr:formylglycine-generating enzyme family protein [Candidatus Electrothrix sp. ATG2]